jgi:hypothetical protein
VQALTAILNDENSSHDDKLTALNKLQGISPEYFGNLDLEVLKSGDAEKAAKSYADSLYYLAKMKELASQKAAATTLLDQLIEDPNGQLSWLEKFNMGIATMFNMKGAEYGLNTVMGKFMKLQNSIKATDTEMVGLAKKMAVLGVGTTTPTTATTILGGSGITPTGKTKKAGEKYDLSPQNIEILGIDRDSAKKEIETLSDAYMMAMEEASAEFDREFQSKLDEQSKKRGEMLAESFNNSITSLGGDFIGDMFENLVNGKGLENALAKMMMSLGGALQAYGKQVLFAEGAIKLMKATFGTGPGAAIGAIALGGVIKGLASNIKIPALAQGGITMGPQLAMIGDNASGKEAVIPFERMPEFLNMVGNRGGGGNVFIPEMRIQGQDLLVVFNRAKNNR